MTDVLSYHYKNNLRSLNPSLPQVIEHLVQTDVLTRTEASRVASTSGQFDSLCELLAAKGMEKREKIMADIGSFGRGERERGGEGAADGRHSGELGVQLHHKHIYNGRARERFEHGGRREGKSRRSHAADNTVSVVNTSGTSGKQHHQIDPFLIQFYTFICQLLQTLTGQQSHDASHDLSISDWLRADMNADQVLSHFPSVLRRSLTNRDHRHRDKRDGFETVKLSEFLGHFKTYVRRCEAVRQERRAAAENTKLLQSLTARNADLEQQMLSVNTAQIPDAHRLTNGHPRPHNWAEASDQQPHWREEDETAPLKKTVKKLEARVQELMATNEQWAVEAGERASENTVLQIQLQDTLEENRRLKGRQHTSGGVRGVSNMISNGTVPGDSEEQLQRERERERDVAVRECQALKAQLAEEMRGREEDKDQIEELKDRAANLRVQAQGKMPTVQEMTALTSENRELREAVEQGRAEMEALTLKLRKLQAKHSSVMCNGETTADPIHTSRSTNRQTVLVEPLTNGDDHIGINGVGDSPFTTATAGASKQMPISDASLLAPKKEAPPSSQPHPTPLPSTTYKSTETPSHSSTRNLSVGNGPKSPKRLDHPPTRPPLPNQPEAVTVARMKLGVGRERKCPKCSTVFLMLGEREFQSHVARCSIPAL